MSSLAEVYTNQSVYIYISDAAGYLNRSQRVTCQSSERSFAARHYRTHLLRGRRTVIHENHRRYNVHNESDDGQRVRRDPRRYLLHQPVPVYLAGRLEERATGRAVLVFLQTLELDG